MIIFTLLTLIVQSTSQLCSNDLDQEFQLSVPNTSLRITYQLLDQQPINIINKTMIEITSTQKETITFSYSNNVFQIFSNNKSKLKNFVLSPGQYMIHEIFCREYQRRACKFKTQINQLKEMQFKICLDQDFVQHIRQELKQQKHFNFFFLNNLDNKFFHASFWIKEIVPGNLPIQIIFSQQQGCIFIFNFKTNKIICCDIKFEKELLIQESLLFNAWFYFEFDQFFYRQEFNNFFILGQFRIEQTKSFKTQINYSFQNVLKLNYPNSIISNFVLKQSFQLEDQLNICMPDCKQCNKDAQCIECVNDLILESGQCYCQNVNQVSDQNGNCQYPANLLQLGELESTSQCQFGYNFSDIVQDCVLCPYEDNTPSISCLLGLSQDQTHIQIQAKQDFENKFQKQYKQVIQRYKCPRNCLICVMVKKIIICKLCKQGQLDKKRLCQLCRIEHCQYCFTFIKQTCLACFEFYSLNKHQKCVQSKEYQFDKLVSYLKNSYPQGDETCQITDQHIGCIMCQQGLIMQNGICVKYQQFNAIYDQNSILTKYPLISFVVNLDNKIYIKHFELLNLQKVYFEQAIRSKILIDQSSQSFTPSYYSKDINKYSFCKKIHNCDNYIQLDMVIRGSIDGLCLQYDGLQFYNINFMLSILQLYDVNPKYIVINIQSDLTFFVGINKLASILNLDPSNKYNVKLNYTGGHIFNEKNIQHLNISSPQIIYFNDVNFVNNLQQQLIINFDNNEIHLKNVNIEGNISFIFTNQTKVNIQLFQLTQNKIETEFIFKFLSYDVKILLENIYIYDFQVNNTIIFLIQSGITSFEFKNSIFHNITLSNSSLIYYGLNISEFNQIKQMNYNISILCDELQFHELKFDNSFLIQSQPDYLIRDNIVIIQNNRITKCKLVNSGLYQFYGQQYKIFRMDTIIMTQIVLLNSNFIQLNYQLENLLDLTNISLINCFVKDNILITIRGGNSIIINGLLIQQLVLSSVNSSIIFLTSRKVYVTNFTLINEQAKIAAKSLLIIVSSDIQIKNTLIQSQSNDNINLQRGILLQSYVQIAIINLKINNLNFQGDSFLSIQLMHQTILLLKGLDFQVTFLPNSKTNEQFERQKLIQVLSSSNYSVYVKDLNIKLIFQESQQHLSRCAFYSIGQSNIKLVNVTINIDNNGSVPNSVIYIEGNKLEILQTQITFLSQKIIENMNKQQNYIFHISCKTLSIQFITLDIKDIQIGVFYLMSNLQFGDRIWIHNVTVQNGSQIDTFFTSPFSTHQQAYFSNIYITSSINRYYIFMFLASNRTKLIMKNMTLIQQNSNNINSIVINGHKTLQISLINIYLSKSNLTLIPENNLELYLKLFARQVNLHNFVINQLNQPAFKIFANQITFQNLIITQVQSLQNILTIDVSSRIIICNSLIQQSQSAMSIININPNSFKELYFKNLKFKENIIENGHLIVFEMNNLKNYSNHRLQQTKLVFYNMQSIQNLCKICYKFINNVHFNLSIQIKDSFEINSKGNQIFELQNFSSTISNSFYLHNSYDDQFFISSSQSVLFNNSQIVLSEGMMTKSIYLSQISYFQTIVQTKKRQDNTLKQNINLFPTLLKLSINTLSQEIFLQSKSISDNIKQFSVQHSLYFPSGMKLNGYKILKLDQRQYQQYIDHIYIYGYNEQNNIKLQINKCDLSNDNDNITMFPNYINSSLFLSDVVFIGNPYLIDNFTLKISCQYEEFQLQLVINSKFLKCQLGEILQDNQCQQCNVKQKLYSVKKHSQMCKLIDLDKIDNVQIGLLQLKPGYWRPYYSNDQIEYCQFQHCLGGWNVDYNTCAQGYIGPQCSECDYNNIRGHGYYSKYRQQCFECQYEVSYIYNILYIVLISLITLTITARSQYLICQRYQVLICQNKYYQILNKLSIDQISVLFKQIQNYFFYLQFVNIIFDIDLNLGLIVNTVSNPIQILNPQYDCIISQFHLNQQITKIIIQIITPICILVLFYIIIILINNQVKFKYFQVFIYTPILQFFIIYQIVICQSAISQLTYIKISGIKWIYGSRQYQYFESTNIHLFIILSIIILIFAITVPFIFVMILNKKQDILQSKVILMKIGYLYQEYTNNKYYWEFLKMTIKIIYITLSFAFITNFILLVPVSTFYIVCMIQLLKQLKPYYLQNLNQFDQQFHILFVINLLIIGVIQHIESQVKTILIIILYLINILYFYQIMKIIIIKTYYNNPQLIDKIRLQVLNAKGKSLVETKKQISNKYSLLKRYAKAQTKQINDEIASPQLEQNNGNSPIMIQSNIMSNLSHQEIELVTFKQQ